MKRAFSNVLMLFLLLAISHWDGQDANASGGRTITLSKSRATLAGSSTQSSASGYAEYVTISFTKSSNNSTTTNSFLVVHVKHLTLADSTSVTFELNGTSIGTGTVRNGHAWLHLLTVEGDTVPAVTANDTLTVIETTGATTDLTGEFGTATTKTWSR